MAASRYEVFPRNEGWRYRSPDGHESKKFETRAEALAAAREARGDDRQEIFDAAGVSLGEHVLSRGPEAIVLLREDGSLYGEIDHEIVDGAGSQAVSVTPAGETGEAVNG